jgi:hypothetical protein
VEVWEKKTEIYKAANHSSQTTKAKEASIMTLRRFLLIVLSGGLAVGIVAAQTKIAKPAKIIDGWLYEIPKTTVAPVIDGIQDPVWKTLDWNFQRSYSNGNEIPDDWMDLMGAHKVMWDDDNMYVLFFTQDDNPTGNDAAVSNYLRNGVEVYFDPTNRKMPGPNVVPPDHHLTFRHEHIGSEANSDWDVEDFAARPIDTTGLVWKLRDDPNLNGYWLEFKIPLDAIDVPAIAGQLIGLEFQQNDNDGNSRESISKWWEMAGDSSWQFASAWGTGILSSRVANTQYEIKKVPEGKAPTIDGDLDPIYLQGTSVTTNSFGNGNLYPDDWSDAFFRTYVLWDDDNLYCFFGVNDDDPTGNDAAVSNYLRNGVEFYVDPTNRKMPGPNVVPPDHHLTFRHEHISNEANSDWDVEDFSARPIDTTGLVWKIKERPAGTDLSHGLVDPGGYNVEVKVPLDAVDVAAIEGQVIGFELQQNDNDGNGRESILKWWLEQLDSSWQFASTWGTAYLGSAIVTGVEESPTAVPYRFELAQNYPNPFNPTTKIQYTLKNSGIVRLAVYDLLGREVAVLVNGVRTAGSYEVTFSRPDLGSGVYFYKLQTGGQVITKKMVLMK